MELCQLMASVMGKGSYIFQMAHGMKDRGRTMQCMVKMENTALKMYS